MSNTSIVKALEDGNATKDLASLIIIESITVTEQLQVTQTTVQSPPSTVVPTGILIYFVLLFSGYM